MNELKLIVLLGIWIAVGVMSSVWFGYVMNKKYKEDITILSLLTLFIAILTGPIIPLCFVAGRAIDWIEHNGSKILDIVIIKAQK